MMNLLQAIIMGLVQGATEFLPVSSSGHLVLTKSLLGVHAEGVLWEVGLHLGTLAAVILVFRRDLRDVIVGFCSALAALARGSAWKTLWDERPGFRLACGVILGTFPAALIGVAFKHYIEGLFANPLVTAAMLFVTGEILWLSRPHSLLRPDRGVGLRDSLWIGIAQAVALVPGISRSGATISVGLMCDVNRDQAARFSFLLSVPAILGASVLEFMKISGPQPAEIFPLLIGVCTAAVVGYIALRILLRVVRAGRLHSFAYYCWGVSVLSLAYFWAAH